MTINIAIVGGNVAADPEYKDMPNGDTVVNFTVATSYRKEDGTPNMTQYPEDPYK